MRSSSLSVEIFKQSKPLLLHAKDIFLKLLLQHSKVRNICALYNIYLQQVVLLYRKYNIPMNPHVRLLVVWVVAWFDSLS